MKFQIILEIDTENMVNEMSASEAAGKAVAAFQGVFAPAEAPVKSVAIKITHGYNVRHWISNPVSWVKRRGEEFETYLESDRYMIDLKGQ